MPFVGRRFQEYFRRLSCSMILDVKMKAVVLSSGLLQDVENGLHAATSASSAALTVSTLSR
jgi:hypothetical protein